MQERNFKNILGGTYVHLWLIHTDVWEKSNQYCKPIINQLQIISKKNDGKISATELFSKLIPNQKEGRKNVVKRKKVTVF